MSETHGVCGTLCTSPALDPYLARVHFPDQPLTVAEGCTSTLRVAPAPPPTTHPRQVTPAMLTVCRGIYKEEVYGPTANRRPTVLMLFIS